ncbi:hypothetical protein PF010_g30466 [Phytophthora fragariae]|uniref:Secreted protein n=1 Tax=Phytophthora fragariae TaxID=53985 RepID=A0A6A3H7Q4_9STRA|nr:hypothetical protein PF011_g28401 [Phytophthora fragariae]KAE9059825.1 hypothetical protein PF010_g30466 [Phytophthora fragariae]KAE9277482.1 hypothetical protein PF008_g28843 [Phytophthora fragariae]
MLPHSGFWPTLALRSSFMTCCSTWSVDYRWGRLRDTPDIFCLGRGSVHAGSLQLNFLCDLITYNIRDCRQ